MYTDYWQLSSKPFEAGVDPRVYYPSEAHQGALLKLRYAIENRRGGALLAGGAGTGKTLLVRTLLGQLHETVAPRIHLVFPQMSCQELVAWLTAEIAGTADGSSVEPLDVLVRKLGQALTENAAQGRHALVVIDEAHTLDGNRVFDALRMLLNFEYNGQPTLTLLLTGQTPLLPILERMPPFEERLGVACLTPPLTLDETMGYVQHRLTAAGASRTIFEHDALEAIFEQTHGNPRRINRLCDLALLVGYAEEQPSITAAGVQQVREELLPIGA